MKLRVFQSSKGDCLLLEGSGGGVVLCDGGMQSSMRDHVRSALSNLAAIDAVYVSHIDQDHISGVLQLLEDALEWRVFRHHEANGDDSVSVPGVPEPPPIRGLWHNSFRDLITKNRGSIDKLAASVIGRELAFAAPVMIGTNIPEAMDIGHEMLDIATSIPEALKVRQLARPDILDIPVNAPASGELMLVDNPTGTFDVGSLRFSVVGPDKTELFKLRKGWDNWLREQKNRDTTRAIREKMKENADMLASGTFHGSPFDLGDWNGIPDFEGVTPPNTASLVLVVEDGGKLLLLTGDSQQDVIQRCMEKAGALDGFRHFDVLKVPHHGSEHNADAEFCKRISADHYVFCGDGSNGNPEPTVLQMYFDSRSGSNSDHLVDASLRGRDFHFWFSTHASMLPANSTKRTSFEATAAKAEALRQASNGRLHLHFNQGDSLTLEP